VPVGEKRKNSDAAKPDSGRGEEPSVERMARAAKDWQNEGAKI
jgi:hypothetical protein